MNRGQNWSMGQPVVGWLTLAACSSADWVKAGYFFGRGAMSVNTLLKAISIPCFYGAIRFAAHGKTFGDGRSLAIGGVFLFAAIALVVAAFWIGRKKKGSTTSDSD